MKDSNELKTCPFCGVAVCLIEREGFLFISGHKIECYAALGSGYPLEKRDKLIETWNQREK